MGEKWVRVETNKSWRKDEVRKGIVVGKKWGWV